MPFPCPSRLLRFDLHGGFFSLFTGVVHNVADAVYGKQFFKHRHHRVDTRCCVDAGCGVGVGIKHCVVGFSVN